MKRLYGYLYEPVLALPFALGLTLLFHGVFGAPKAGVGIILLTVLSIFVCSLVRFLDGRERFIPAGAAVLLLLIPFLYGRKRPGYLYNHRFLWIIPAVAACCFVLACFCRISRFARYTCILAVLGILVFLLLEEYKVPRLGLTFLFAFFILLIADETQTRWRRQGDTEHATHLPAIAPFIALLLLICSFFPIKSEPYDWRFFRNIIEKIEDLSKSISVKIHGTPDDFESIKPGFSETTRVRGGTKMENDDRVLFTVSPRTVSSKVLRLGGQVCDSFKDMEWSATDSLKDSTDYGYDLLETLVAFDSAAQFSDYARWSTVDVSFKDFSTDCLFVPLKSFTDPDSLARIGAEEKGGNLYFTKRAGSRTDYYVAFLQLNRRHSTFSSYIGNPEPITEEAWRRVLVRQGRPLAKCVYSGLASYRQRMKNLYGQPVSVSDKTRAFLTEATAGTANAYEAMLALERTLSGFEYSKTVPPFPKNVKDAYGFLDSFLDTRIGSCVHYATAMTLLARAYGLPARYVNGFYVPIDGVDTVSVTTGMSHSWCEIYFENLGWIAFDATPGYDSDYYWATREEMELSGHGDGTVPIYTQITPSVKPVRITATPTPGPEDDPISREEGGFLFFCLIGLGGVLVFTVSALLIDRFMARKRFKKMSAYERVLVLYRRNMRILGWLRLPPGDSETLLEYAERLKPLVPEDGASWLRAYDAFMYAEPGNVSWIAEEMLHGNKTLLSAFKKRNPVRYRIYGLANRFLR